jgi:hypothetical protein
LKQQIQQLIAFMGLIFGIAAIILLTGARACGSIRPGPYLFWMTVAGIVMYLDDWWIDKHFIDGEWE